MLYRWTIFVHLVGVFTFLLAHGTSVSVAFKVRAERQPARIHALLELAGVTAGWMYFGLLLLMVGGVAAGFLGHWWGHGWMWASLGTLAAQMLLMYAFARGHYQRLRAMAGAMADGAPAEDAARLAALSAGARPWILAIAGVGGILFVLYLMMFKPF